MNKHANSRTMHIKTMLPLHIYCLLNINHLTSQKIEYFRPIYHLYINFTFYFYQ